MSLHQGDAGFSVFHDHLDGLIIKRIFLGVALTKEINLPGFGIDHATFQDALHVIGRPLGLQVIDHTVHLLIAHKGAMHAHRVARATVHVQHVAHSKQRLGTHLIQNGARINFAAHLESNARGDIGLDEASDHINAWALCCQNQMHPSSPCFLCKTCNQLFDFFAHHHHQIGQLVNDHHHMGQATQGLGRVGRQTKGVVNKSLLFSGFIDFGVVTGQISNAQFAHELVAPLHLDHTPIQRMGGLTHVCHDRCQQVRNPLIDGHLQHFGVDHEQPHIARFSLVEQRQDHGIDPNGFA